MDKQNYTRKTLTKQELKKHFSQQTKALKKALEKRNLIRRKRVVKDISLLLTAIRLYFIRSLSFQRLAEVMACEYGTAMSATAWRKQFYKLSDVLGKDIETIPPGRPSTSDGNAQILGHTRVYAADATDFPKEGRQGTDRRVHTLYSLSEHRCIFAQSTDCHGGESLARFPLQPGALYFADRAYGRTPQLAYAIDQKADFVIRLSPHTVRLFTSPDCTQKISFPSLMADMSKTTFSLPCFFKHKGKLYTMRLIGSKLPEDKHPQAVKRVSRKASRNQRSASPQALENAKWMFLATSLPDSFSIEQILHAYRLRWQIELHFKRTKHFLNFHKIRRSSPSYSSMIVSLWLAVAFFLASLQLFILRLSNFSISDFRAFSLAVSLSA